MLRSLYVKNVALIEEIEVDFQNGLNILTGETGAGKSIILGSINLALGGRYSADVLRDETEPGYVELVFSVENKNQISLLKEKDIYPENGMVILSRKMIDKRSISKINGETVPISLLKEVSAVLIDIHGQHEHQSLLYKKNHLTILDMYAKEQIGLLKSQVAEQYHIYRAYQNELEHAGLDEKERMKEMSFLEFERKEISDAGLKPGEDDDLEEQYRRMVNGKKITENIDEAYSFTTGSGSNASDMLSRAIRSLQDAAHYDEKADDLYQQLSEVDSLLNDFNRELAQYRESFEFSDEEFYEVEKRLNEINRLKTKYGNRISDILAYLTDVEQKLCKLRDYDNYLEELQQKTDESERKLKQLCSELSGLRKVAGEELERSIRMNLLDLNFLDVQFQIVFKKTEDYTLNGIDDIEFMISMNPGESVRPLQDVASGGELSRIMLAIKTVMAEKDQIETLIFDEIDVGISGRTAQKVSEKMAVIGKTHQVICITHLAQIAAMADTHFAIEKQAENGKTISKIHRLNSEQEIHELARILGGAEITEKVLQSAAEMKELANATK